MKKKSLRGRVDGAPNPIDIHVGNRVRMCRTLMGMSQERLGQALGLTFQQVQKYERGMNRIGASRLWDISQVLNTPISFFYEGISEDAENLSPRHINENSSSTKSVQDVMLTLDTNPLNRKETLELVRAYYRIPDRNAAHRIFDLIKSLAPPEDDEQEDMEKSNEE